MYNCPFCARNFKNNGGLVSHLLFCKLNPDVKQPMLFICKFCGKQFIGKSGITNHTKFCNMNPDKQTRKPYERTKTVSNEDSHEYICKYCKKLCKNTNSLTQHEIRCKYNPDRLPINDFSSMYQKYPQEIKNKMNWNKGETKETNPSVRLYAEKLAGRKGTMLGKTYTRPKDANTKQSETRRFRILEGKITPVTSHRYINSYIEFQDGRKKFLRSSYELIIAIFLDHCGIPFEYETIRAPYYDESNNLHSFISDFSIKNLILEIKGVYDDTKLTQETIAFEKIGYTLQVVYEKDVFRIRDYLQKTFDIKKLLKQVRQQSRTGNYYVYKLSF